MIVRRCIAFVIDIIVASTFYMIIDLLVGLFVVDPILRAAIASISFTYPFVKDSYTGRGLGKIAVKISVIDIKDQKAASAWATYIRNVLCILWPIEFLVLVINKRRLGDMIAGTDVIDGQITHKFSKEAILITVFTWAILAGIIYLFYQNSPMREFMT